MHHKDITRLLRQGARLRVAAYGKTERFVFGDIACVEIDWQYAGRYDGRLRNGKQPELAKGEEMRDPVMTVFLINEPSPYSEGDD